MRDTKMDYIQMDLIANHFIKFWMHWLQQIQNDINTKIRDQNMKNLDTYGYKNLLKQYKKEMQRCIKTMDTTDFFTY